MSLNANRFKWERPHMAGDPTPTLHLELALKELEPKVSARHSQDWVPCCPPSPSSLGPPSCLVQGPARSCARGHWRGLGSGPSFTCCTLVVSMFGTSVDLSFFYAVVSPNPFLLRHPSMALGSVCLQPAAPQHLSPTPAGEGRVCWGQGPGCGLQLPRAASLSASVFSPRKIPSVLALSPGGLEGFPYTVLRSSANEGPGNAKCSRACVCQ